MSLLNHADILELHRAVVLMGLVSSRTALLAGVELGFVAGLPHATTPSEQILQDLAALSSVGALSDGSMPLAVWLANASALAGMRNEAAIFMAAIARLEGAAASANWARHDGTAPTQAGRRVPAASLSDATTRSTIRGQAGASPTGVAPERGGRDWLEDLVDSPETFFDAPSRRQNLSPPLNQPRPVRGTPSAEFRISDDDVYGMLRIKSRDYAISAAQMIWIKQKMAPSTKATALTGSDAFIALRLCEIVLAVDAERWPGQHGRSVLLDDLQKVVVVALGLLSENPDYDTLPASASNAIKTAVARHWLDSEAVDKWNPGMASGTGWTEQLTIAPMGRKTLANSG